MRILMLVFNMVERGTYFRAYEFARELVKKEHTVTIMATSPNQHFQHKTYFQDGIKLIETPDLCNGSMRSGWDLYNALYRMAIIKSNDFDIVHVFETRPVNLFPALKLRKDGIPLIFDWVDWFGKGGSVEERPNRIIRFLWRPVETFFESSFRKKALATTVICTTLRDRAIALGVDPNSITVLPNGFNIPVWPNYENDYARKVLGIDQQDCVIGYVGSLFPKDAQLMAEAFDLVTDRIPNARLLHVGQSKYGVIKIVKNPNRIIETSKVKLPEMALNLAACDICWLPFTDSNANRGRFPMKFSNYLAAGKPIIATNVGDVAKIIEKYKVGMITSADPINLCRETCNLISDRKQYNSRRLNSIFLSQKKEESWGSRATQIDDIYKRTSNPFREE
jgi:glycosyltransferase involved in cell wall biosynthesis